jgi:dihydrofolate reductase
MRTMSASFFLSLDGVVEAPQDWHFPSFSPDAQAATLADVQGVDTIVLGRVTYQEWLPAWPPQGTSNPMAAFFNTTRKLVVSTTLDALEWDGAEVVSGDVTETLRAEKDKPGGEIAVYGSGRLVTSLLSAGLIDELRVQVHPVVVGRGQRLFEGGQPPYGLELVSTTRFDGGAVGLTYRSTGVG